MSSFEVPVSETREFLYWIETHGYKVLYSVGDTKILAKRNLTLGGPKLRVDPGDVLVLDGDELRVGSDDV